VSDERRAYARRCMAGIVAVDAEHDRIHGIVYEDLTEGGAA
jgi:hypothetical protein